MQKNAPFSYVGEISLKIGSVGMGKMSEPEPMEVSQRKRLVDVNVLFVNEPYGPNLKINAR